MADQADPAPAVASTSTDAAETTPNTEEIKPVETGMTEVEEKEVDTVNPDKAIEESAYSPIHSIALALKCHIH